MSNLSARTITTDESRLADAARTAAILRQLQEAGRKRVDIADVLALLGEV